MNRKSFLQHLGLITGSAFISLKTNAFDQLTRSETITGSVSAEGKAIANAVISDGFSVVTTDAKGKFTLTPNPKAQAIFLSTPAGYDFNVQSNIAKQYENLGVRNEYNFKLKKLRKNDEQHQFLIWADPQVKNKKDVAEMMATSVPDVQALISSMGPNALVHGICVGDIVWDNLPLYDDYNIAVAKMGLSDGG
jgi:hypothetical protein